MPRSSESVGALASALAKAQAALVNPEKSLTATIRSARAGEGERSFRYAPLASGLEIVRRTLGQHEIATLQTTAIDQTAGMVNLTTMLAHASGEWIASDWPVCPIAETANPQRMGAALTYARRYALFTLVGIAGEDDLDAPDLCEWPNAPPSSTLGQGQTTVTPQGWGNGRIRRGLKSTPRAAILEASQSAELRDKLIAEIAGVTSPEGAATWAKQALAAKNSLTATDAGLVESAFEGKLSNISSSDPASRGKEDARTAGIDGGQNVGVAAGVGPDRGISIDKSTLAIAAPRRYRNREHLRFVMQQPCLVCGRKPSDPHHLRYMQPRALGRKASDEFAVPLCRVHHRAAHRAGDERAWWKASGIDPIKIARKLWNDTRENDGRMRPNAMTQARDSDGAVHSPGAARPRPDIG
jgi:hypothetical protein